MVFARQREVFKERAELIKALLGIDLDQEYRKKDPATEEADQLHAFLSENKRQQLRDLEDKYFDLERRIYANANRLTTADDRAALEALRQQKAAEMDALLTPQEQFLNTLCTRERLSSNLSKRLRRSLARWRRRLNHDHHFRRIRVHRPALGCEVDCRAAANHTALREISRLLGKCQLGSHTERQRSPHPGPLPRGEGESSGAY